MNELIDYYGIEVVQAYMSHIQETAELAVKDLLREVGQKVKNITGRAILHAVDFMDDGSQIVLTVNIDVEKGTSIFDFK